LPDDMRPAEAWAWKRIRAGEIADFNSEFGELDPSEPHERWGDDRRVGAKFLRKLFFEKPYQDEIPIEGVRIIGAFLPEGQMLFSGRVNRGIWLDKCRSETAIDLGSTVVDAYLSLEGSWFGQQGDSPSLILALSEIRKGLNLKSATFTGNVILNGAKVGGGLVMDSSTFEKTLDGQALEVDHLFMGAKAKFAGDVLLLRAKTGGVLDMSSSTFEKTLDGDHLQVGHDLLMAERAKFAGTVNLSGAKIGGQLNMSSSTFAKTLNGEGLQVEQGLYMSDRAEFCGDVILRGAKIGGELSLSCSTFEKTLNGNRLQVGQNVSMDQGAKFAGDVNLGGAKIDGDLSVGSSTFAKTLDCDSLQVGRNVFMNEGAKFAGHVNLSAAKIGGHLFMQRSMFEKTLNGSGLQVERDLLMSGRAKFAGDVNLTRAKIGDSLAMSSSTFERTLNGIELQTGGNLYMTERAKFAGDVLLRRAKIDGSLFLDTSTLEKTLDGDSLQIGQDFFMRQTVFRMPVSLLFARVGKNLDLGGATLAGLDLSGGRVTQDFRLTHDGKNAAWSVVDLGIPVLILRNTQVGALQESPNAWPPMADLEGFSYGRLGGFGATGTDDARTRAVKDWKRWLATDGGPNRPYSAQPYAQLAEVLVAAGRRDHANAILFAGRQRERREARRNHRWGRWIWLSMLRWLCGYGIGIQTFWVLPWIIGSILLGTAVLWFGAPAAHQKGLLWCAGASLDRLLPIIHLNKEFADFFDDPERKRLAGEVIAFFSGLSLWGWVLGSFLIAAVSGLTQRS
jgi:hypothetical protein